MRILFINRMLSMCRGGGETFDLEISRHLAELGCEITYLSGIPLFSGAKLAAPKWGGKTEDGSVREDVSNRKPLYGWNAIRTPFFGWFPWDKVRGGWRLRLADFKCFEYLAAKWVLKHESLFDLVQVCNFLFLLITISA
jgi:hypothetical protein